jgi:hypothetical protein
LLLQQWPLSLVIFRLGGGGFRLWLDVLILLFNKVVGVELMIQRVGLQKGIWSH